MAFLKAKKEKLNKGNIIICDCKETEVESLCDALNSDGENFSVNSHIANWKRTGAMSELRRYGKYFAVGFKYFLCRKKYDIIIGWQQFYVLIIGFFCSLFHVKKRNTLVALNFTYKEKQGRLSKLYYRFMKKCLSTGYVDYIHVPSQEYAVITSEKFQFPVEKIIVMPFGINDPYERFSSLAHPSDELKDGYVLSIGRSNRDYDFLISAWEGISYPLVIISDTYEGDNIGNPNVRIIRNVAGEESYPWIANCKAMVIPLDDGTICSGDTVLLTSLAVKKKVLITVPSTLSEMYIADGENGLCVEKEKDKFRSLVNDMIFTDKYDYLHESARESYLKNFSRINMGKRLKKRIF